jgi:hypothetical protein
MTEGATKFAIASRLPKHESAAGRTCAASPKTVTFAYTEGLLTAVPGYASPITYHSNQTIAQVTHDRQAHCQ